MSDLEISTWYQSVADHRRTEGTNINLKFAVVVAVSRENVAP